MIQTRWESSRAAESRGLLGEDRVVRAFGTQTVVEVGLPGRIPERFAFDVGQRAVIGLGAQAHDGRAGPLSEVGSVSGIGNHVSSRQEVPSCGQGVRLTLSQGAQRT